MQAHLPASPAAAVSAARRGPAPQAGAPRTLGRLERLPDALLVDRILPLLPGEHYLDNFHAVGGRAAALSVAAARGALQRYARALAESVATGSPKPLHPDVELDFVRAQRFLNEHRPAGPQVAMRDAFDQEDWTSLLAACDEVLALWPDASEAHANRGLALYRLGQQGAAKVALGAALAADPDHVEAAVTLAEMALAGGRLARAARHVARARATGVASPHLDIVAGRLAYAQGDSARAVALLESVLEPRQWAVQHTRRQQAERELGLAYVAQGNYREALPLLRGSWEIEQAPQVGLALLEAYDLSRDWQEALVPFATLAAAGHDTRHFEGKLLIALDRAVKAPHPTPGQAVPMRHRPYVRREGSARGSREDDLRQMPEALAQLAQLQGTNGPVFRLLAGAYLAAGKLAKARSACNRGLSLLPDDRFLKHLAHGALAGDDDTKARLEHHARG